MGRLKIKGKLFYPPGIWGVSLPVKNANVKIYDIDDFDGSGSDLIWEGTTDNNGRFQGTSREWQDRTMLTPRIPATPISPAIPATYGPNPLDTLILQIKISQGNNNLTGSFPFVGDNIEVPLVVTWRPPRGRNWGTLNGTEFTDFEQLMNQFISKIENNDPSIELKLYGDWSTAVTPIVNLINNPPLRRIEQFFPGSRTGSLVLTIGAIKLTISAAVLVASATLVLAIGALVLLSGASAFLVCMGIVLILAILSGYITIGASQTTTTDDQGNPQNETTIEVSK